MSTRRSPRPRPLSTRSQTHGRIWGLPSTAPVAYPPRTSPRVPLSLALLCLLPSLLPGALPAPFSFTDVYTPRCSPIKDPPPAGFQKWSESSTWPGGVVPGVGKATMANVTIPCNKAVLLDVPSIRLNVLQIQGLLKVLDPPKPATYKVTACFILVEGQLHIGTQAKQFSSQIVFSLAPNPFNRQNYTASFNPPADEENPRIMGHKAFAVMGGYVDMHGMPGGAETPSWVRLAETAHEGQTYIIVDKDVSKTWPLGAKIALTSTSFFPTEAEEVRITAVKSHPKGSQIVISQALVYEHFGDPKGIPDGFGGFVDERAEVALLSRNIIITGVDEKPPHQYEGGHFMVFLTQTPQSIEGVEYWLMGQQGTLGRYNIHLHVCGDVRGKFLIRKNSIHDSKQRCVVVHATHNVTVDSNVAYNTSGHCFMVEEGGEMDNTFINNLGFLTRKPDRLIMDGPTPGTSLETDFLTSTFWITNMRNRFIGNVAAGSVDSGFWTELRPGVRGFSEFIPSIQNIIPAYTPILEFRDNVAHSNFEMGFRCYPNGIKPKAIYDSSSTVPTGLWESVDGVIRNFVAYKHKNEGFFMHASENIYLVNSTFADNRVGVELRSNSNGGVSGSRFVGTSANLGSLQLSTCQGATGQNYCAPIKGCKFDPSNAANLRSTGSAHWLAPKVGILIDQFRLTMDGQTGIFKVTDNWFHAFENPCPGQSTGAIGIGIGNGVTRDWWNAGQSFSGFKLSKGSNPIWFSPAKYVIPGTNPPFTYFSGEPGTNYAVRDLDGGMSGTRGAAIIGDSKVLRPPKSVKCTAWPRSNGLVCPGACFRSLQLSYLEPGFTPLSYEGSSTRKSGDYSWVSIKRVVDGVTRTSDGNLNSHVAAGDMRFFINSLYAPAEYEVTIHPPKARPNWAPDNVSITFRDSQACPAALTVTVLPAKGRQWAMDENDDQFWSPCPGVQYPARHKVQYSVVCQGAAQALKLELAANLDYLTVLRSQPATPCPSTSECGVYSQRELYWYDTSGRELHSPAPGAMGFQTPLYPQPGWKRGQAIIGNAGYNWTEIHTITPQYNGTFKTFYFRKTFSLAASACYSTLNLDFFQVMGLVVYLNGVELFRHNMPNGGIMASTPSVAKLGWPAGVAGAMNSTSIDLRKSGTSLVEGTNYLAFETHPANKWQSDSYFDTRVSLRKTADSCKRAATSVEICDGIDNDRDGKVDVDPKTGKLLTRPCSTACGNGTETCILGAYAKCSAPAPRAEVCNGKDDNCDGLVDNGRKARLNCPKGNVCFQGKCQQTTVLTSLKPLVHRGSASWVYNRGTLPLRTYPNWFTGSPRNVVSKFKRGKAPFATATARVAGAATTLGPVTASNPQTYFLMGFKLTAQEAASTSSLSVSVRRDQGVLVLSNGVEVLKNNMFSWFDPQNPDHQLVTSNMQGTDVATWYNNTPTPDTGFTGKAVKEGENWLAAIVATDPSKSKTTFFDLEVFRNVNVTCNSLPGKPASCVRVLGPDTVLLPFYDTWKYLDASRPLPPDTWKSPSFNDQGWPEAPGILGNIGVNLLDMDRTRRVTYYFRRTLDIPDGHCFFELTVSFKVLDGAVFYVNGAVAYRFQMDPDLRQVLPTSFSSYDWPPAGSGNFTLSAGWLLKGKNVLAVELHLSAQNTTTWVFDLSLTGQREAGSCLPAPQ